MKIQVVRIGLLLGILCLLSGCYTKTVNDLYCLPKAPQDYVELDTRIASLLEELNAEYASPKSGSNTSPVQLQDLDGDGLAESVITFFRAGSGELPLKIYVLRQQEDNSYSVTNTIESDGLAISSISYVDLTGDGVKELLVSWQMGTRQYILTPYQLGPTDTIQLGEISYNQGYTACDLDGDKLQELVVFRIDQVTQENGWAEWYTYTDGQMVRASSAPLSDNTRGDCSIRESFLKDKVPAVYVSSSSGDGTLTDVFALRGGQLTNVTLDPETGISAQIVRNVDIAPKDINGDGILELPQPVAVQEYQPTGAAPNFWLIYWRQFDLDGGSQVVQNTYHNSTDEWYLTIPDQWIGHITISRDDSRTNQGERAVIFSHWEGVPDTPPAEFLRIYRLEGENRESRANLGNRFVLLRSGRLIYAAELTPAEWDCGMTKDNLLRYFSLNPTEWSNQ